MSLPGGSLSFRRSAPPPVSSLTAQDWLPCSEPEVRLSASVRTRSWSPATQFRGRASRGRRQLPTAGACLHHTRTTPSPSRGARRRGWCSSSCWTRRCCSGIQERARTDAESRISGSEQGSQSWAVRELTGGGADRLEDKRLLGRGAGTLKTDSKKLFLFKVWHAF